jgi:hypothetical protein
LESALLHSGKKVAMKAQRLFLLFAASMFASVGDQAADFVVGSPPCYGPPTASDSPDSTNAYILPITAASDLEKARLRAATGGCYPQDGDFRPVIEIGLGSDGTNRNTKLPDQPLWSWHVRAFVGWTGISEGYRWPFDIEEGVLDGTLRDGDRVALSEIFTTVDELNPPLELFMTPYDQSFLLYWTYHAPNSRVSVEWSDSLSSGRWLPVLESFQGVQRFVGQSWLIDPAALHPYYRLRLDPIVPDGFAAANFIVGFPPYYGMATGEYLTNAYILPIAAAADLQKARLLVATGGYNPYDGDSRPVFEIGLGSDGTNRNTTLLDQPLWSWHVKALVGWASPTDPPSPYTHPFEIEAAVLNGTIKEGDTVTLNGTYPTISELGSVLRLYTAPHFAGFWLFWIQESPAAPYHPQWTDSLASGDWQPLAPQTPGVFYISGQAWQIVARGPPRFFRVVWSVD